MPPPSLLLLAACLLASFLYAGIEAGLLSLNRARLRSRARQGERGAARLERLLARPGRLLATVLLVTNLADVAALVLVTDALVRRLGARGYAVAGVALLPVYLLGLQLLPKALFRRFPYRALAALAGLLEGTTRLLGPLLAAGRWLLGRTLLPPLPAASLEQRASGRLRAREELQALAAEAAGAGALAPAERGMVANALAYHALTARALMRPLPEPFRLPAPGSETPRAADLLAFAQARGLEHVLALDAAGGLAGLVDGFTLLLERDPQRPAAAFLRRPPLVVAPDEPALRVLRRLRSLRLKAAVVREGEAGGAERLVGIVRTADLLQRLVRERAGESPG